MIGNNWDICRCLRSVDSDLAAWTEPDQSVFYVRVED